MMENLEQIIIHTVFSEQRYNEVSFLDPEDFTNKGYRSYWFFMKETNGDVEAILTKAIKDKREDIIEFAVGPSSLFAIENLQQIAVRCKEESFKRVFHRLLTVLSSATKNVLERELLSECILKIPQVDLFILSSSILDYLGHHASDYTKSRISGYLDFESKQVLEVKNVLRK